MNKKSIPGAKSMKMSADDLKEMVKQAVKECLGDEEKDLTEQDDPTLNEGIMEVIEAAVEAATEKRKARKEAGEEVSEDLTADEVLAEAAAILDAMETGDDETKADDEETEEKEDDEEAEAKAAKATKKRQTKTRAAAPAQRKYSDIYMARAAARQDLLAMRRVRALRFQTAEAMQAAVSFRELGQILKDSRAALEPYEAAQPPTLRVGVVGDIYSVIDTSLNRDLQWQLAERGVRTRRSMTLSGYVKESVGLSRRWSREAKPYLNRRIGGFARQTVGCAAWAAREKWDGLLQVYPLYCMPEAVAESILPVISREYDIPVLRLVLDEHTGEEGYMTRLEAFVDLLEQRRKGHERVLSRN